MLRPTGRSVVPATMINNPMIVPPLVPLLTPRGQGTGLQLALTVQTILGTKKS